MIQKVDHIGVAVHSIEASLPFYRDTLGLSLVHQETVEEQGVKVAFLKAGETTIELLEPLRPDSPVGKFLAQRGEGVHHVAFGVDDLMGDRGKVAAAGVRLLSDRPLDGAHGKQISFLHPKDSHGVLTELCQRAPKDP
jgi:methylmalonyl-CoA/ethylmalonyl-CoA epimerase